MDQQLYKEDWGKAKTRMEAWWNGEVLDRPALQVTAPRDKPIGRIKQLAQPSTLYEQWTNADYVLDKAENYFKQTFFGGEAFPMWWPNFGPDIFAAYLGCAIEFGENTSWSFPLNNSLAEIAGFTLDEENFWWKKTVDFINLGVQRGKGRFIVGLTDIHPGADGLAALRDPQQLALDAIDDPEGVKEALDALFDVFVDVYTKQYDLVKSVSGGSTAWLQAYAENKRWYPTSCDFCCMLSSEMFKDVFLDELIDEMRWLDRSLFHLDGPGALHHLDTFLNIPELGGIQWVPGAGEQVHGMSKWIPVLKRIQAADKLIHIDVQAHEVEPLLEELSPKGLMMSTSCKSETEARLLLKRITKYT
mgnify:CR=1 FL=1